MSENGERLARLEAEVRGLREAMLGHWHLDDEREKTSDEFREGLRREMHLLSEANKAAIEKVEVVTDKRFDLLSEQAERRIDTTDKRLGALEKGESGRRGAAELKASTIAWLGALAAVALIVVSLISSHTL